jgi:hypothetical protein
MNAGVNADLNLTELYYSNHGNVRLCPDKEVKRRSEERKNESAERFAGAGPQVSCIL